MPRQYQKKHPDKTNIGRPVEWTEEKAIELANELLDWMLEEENVYFEKFLVVNKRLYPELIADLSSKYPMFSQSVKRARKIQEMKLAQLLLNMKGNPGGVIFALKNNGHNWTDKRETKSENVNYNYDPKDLKAKTEEELQDMLLNLTKKPSPAHTD